MINFIKANRFFLGCLTIIFLSSFIASIVQSSFTKVEIDLKEFITIILNENDRIPANYIKKRNTKKRKGDFNEIYNEFITEKAREQSSRCSQCGVPFCQVHCPLHNNIPDWLKLTAEGRLKEAYELSQSTNNMPEVCGRICPQDRLCEGNCVIEQSGHGTVTIGSVEKFLTETAWENNWIKPIDVKNEIDQSLSLIHI